MSGKWKRRVVSNKTCQEDEKEDNWMNKTCQEDEQEE